MTTPPAALPRRRLTDRGAALALALGMLAVPGIPFALNSLLPQRDWGTAESGADLTVTTRNNTLAITAPAGWQSRTTGDGLLLRNGDQRVLVQAFDVDQHDAAEAQRRVMRATRIGGITAAFDGGTISTADGALRGRTCVAIADDDVVGPCAYLTDDDVLVTVTSLGTPDTPAAGLEEFVAPLRKEPRA